MLVLMGFLFHLGAEVGPMQPPKHLRGQVARTRQPGSCTHHWSLVHSYFKAERSKTELERNYNFHPVPCYCLLQSCTNVGLSGSGPTSPHWSQLRTYLQVTRGKTQVVAAPGHLPWPLLGATGTSCSHGRGHCCTLTMHSRFYCRSTYSF